MTQPQKAIAAHQAILAQMMHCEAILEEYTRALGSWDLAELAELAGRCPALLRQALDLVRNCRAQAGALEPIPPPEQGPNAQELLAVMAERIKLLCSCLRATEQELMAEFQLWGISREALEGVLPAPLQHREGP